MASQYSTRSQVQSQVRRQAESPGMTGSTCRHASVRMVNRLRTKSQARNLTSAHETRACLGRIESDPTASQYPTIRTRTDLSDSVQVLSRVPPVLLPARKVRALPRRHAASPTRTALRESRLAQFLVVRDPRHHRKINSVRRRIDAQKIAVAAKYSYSTSLSERVAGVPESRRRYG